MKVANKVILVTGGDNGLGRELVLALLKNGSNVVAVDINESALQGTEQLAGLSAQSLMLVSADITDKNMIQTYLKKSKLDSVP